MALVIGATLGLAGAVLQVLRNPLAEPGLIGASATASLGAVLAFYFGLADQFALLCAFQARHGRNPGPARRWPSCSPGAYAARSVILARWRSTAWPMR
ncbi:MAG: iron chelate uptake ABC transporter family permease subunit [Gammaproteobacteria bacterium]